MFAIKKFWGTIDFHSMGGKNTMKVNSAPQLLCCKHSLKYLLLCSTNTISRPIRTNSTHD